MRSAIGEGDVDDTVVVGVGDFDFLRRFVSDLSPLVVERERFFFEAADEDEDEEGESDDGGGREDDEVEADVVDGGSFISTS